MRSHAVKLSPRTIALAGLVVLALVIAGCGGTSYGSGSGSKPAPSTSTAAPASGATAAGIPQNNGGDQDGDNNGGPSDGDGNI